jgi:toxin ParE1/3/4
MTLYVLSRRARIDLDEIWDYTAERWGSDQAEQYLRMIRTGLETAAAQPMIGVPSDHIRPGYRKYPVGSHVFFYRITDTGIDVARVLHARRDFGRHLRLVT